MGRELKKSLSWEIDNIFEREDEILFNSFSSGGYDWRVRFRPKGIGCYDNMYLHLEDTSPKSFGWKKIACFCFVLLNEYGRELYRTPNEGQCRTLCAEIPCLGFKTKMTRAKLQEEGLIDNNKLIIEVLIQVVEVVVQGKSTENDILDFNGLNIIASHALSVSDLFYHHPDFAKNFKPKNQEVITEYINLILGLTNMLSKSPRSLSVTELSNAQGELSRLTEAGFKLDWLKSRLDEISLERKKALSDGSSWVQQLEERVKNVETTLSDLRVELHKEKTKAAAAPPRVSSFNFIDLFIKRFFLSCFSISKY